MNNVVKSLAAVAAVALFGSAVVAQTPPPPPAHPGILSRLFHPKPKPGTMNTMHPGMTGNHTGMMPYHSGMPMHSGMTGRPGMMGGAGMMGGRVIGNKNTHVFHMPGDTGSLPSPQNRVYFSSAAAARAAGYHAAGGHGMSGRQPMMQGGMVRH